MKTPAGISIERLLQDAFQRRWEITILRRPHRERVLPLLHGWLRGARFSAGRRAGQQFTQNDPQRVDIRADIGYLPQLETFWSQLSLGDEPGARERQCLLPEGCPRQDITPLKQAL